MENGFASPTGDASSPMGGLHRRHPGQPGVPSQPSSAPRLGKDPQQGVIDYLKSEYENLSWDRVKIRVLKKVQVVTDAAKNEMLGIYHAETVEIRNQKLSQLTKNVCLVFITFLSLCSMPQTTLGTVVLGGIHGLVSSTDTRAATYAKNLDTWLFNHCADREARITTYSGALMCALVYKPIVLLAGSYYSGYSFMVNTFFSTKPEGDRQDAPFGSPVKVRDSSKYVPQDSSEVDCPPDEAY